MSEPDTLRRAVAALRGLAIGDAMGAATDGYRPDDVLAVYETPITELVEPVNLYPESAPDRVIGEIGSVTQTALRTHGFLTGAAGSLPDAASLTWAVALGIARRPDAFDLIAAEAGQIGGGPATVPGTVLALAVANAVSGMGARECVALAVQVAERAGDLALAALIRQAVGIAQESGGRRAGEQVAALCDPAGDLVHITAFAFGVVYGTQSVRRALPQAVNQGGAASLTAALVGPLCGALAPMSVPESWAAQVERVNGLDLARVAGELLRLRG